MNPPPSASPARLGAFRLGEPLARGGMARLFHAEHVASGTPVAIKVLSAHAGFRSALENEVRAMARLDSRRIALVLDHGTVPASPPGDLVPGSPWLAIELAPGAPLRPSLIADWPTLKSVLVGILEGLAHAHARGVIHRDVKPSNVMVGFERGTSVKLVDFGISRAIQAAAGVPGPIVMSGGTPYIMAPEQILGQPADEGPWTDLYSVGCLAYRLVCGRYPFMAPRLRDLFRAHCVDQPAPLTPRFEVPADLGPWIATLLAKRPQRRFQLAPDAIHALVTLGGPGARTLTPASQRLPSAKLLEETRTSPGSTVLSPAERRELAAGLAAAVEDEAEAVTTRRMRAPLTPPPQALPADQPGRLRRLLGAGLGLFGLRTIPLSGRVDERKRLWTALRQVHETRRPRCLIVRGAAGVGKTRLARWLCESALELGSATAMWADHGPPPGPSDGLAGLVRRALVAERSTAHQLHLRLAATPGLDGERPEDSRTREILVDLALPEQRGDRPGPDVAERTAAVRRLLAARSRARPLILVVDNAQWAAPTLHFVRELLRARRPPSLPVLVVVLAQAEALRAQPEPHTLLKTIHREGLAQWLELGPLDEAQHRSLVRDLLCLDEDLAISVGARTAGNPLFAVQLVEDWIHRGLLEPGPSGFRAREGAALAVPDSIHELCQQRFSRLVGALPAGRRAATRVALELLALLGTGAGTSLHEWLRACRELQLEPPEGLLHQLAVTRLAVVDGDRFGFSHGMLAESLQREARESGRWAQLHRACAEMLAATLASDDPARAERLGLHLMEAGDGLAAHPHLLTAARRRLDRGELFEAEALCARYHRALEQAGVPEGDERRSRGTLLQAQIANGRGRLRRAAELLAGLEGALPADSILWARALRIRGSVALKQGLAEESGEALLEARSRFERAGNLWEAADCLRVLAEGEKLRGLLDDAEAHFQEARACAVSADNGDPLFDVWLDLGLADVYRRRGRLEEAKTLTTRALRAAGELGNHQWLAVALNCLGDLARLEGLLGLAESYYRRSLESFEAAGSLEARVASLNLGIVLLAAGRFREARETFSSAHAMLGETGQNHYRLYALAGLVTAAAGEHRWSRMRAHLADLQAATAEVGVVDDDLAWCLERAGGVAAAEGLAAEARAAWTAALAQWRRLGRRDASARLEGLLGKPEGIEARV